MAESKLKDALSEALRDVVRAEIKAHSNSTMVNVRTGIGSKASVTSIDTNSLWKKVDELISLL